MSYFAFRGKDIYDIIIILHFLEIEEKSMQLFRMHQIVELISQIVGELQILLILDIILLEGIIYE